MLLTPTLHPPHRRNLLSRAERVELERRLYAVVLGRDAGERGALAEGFFAELAARSDTPLTIDDRAYFLHYGPAAEVSLAGDWTHWQAATKLKQISGTQLFYTAITFPKTARLQYKLIVDGEWMLDPANERYSQEGFGRNSEFFMPEHFDESWLWLTEPERARGTIATISIESAAMNESRELLLYTPHADIAPGTNPLPLLVVHDGAEAISIGYFPAILDNLIAYGRIRPCAALFIPPNHRNSEYAYNDRYIRFCSREALPAAVAEFRRLGIAISGVPRETCVMGASLGGLLSTLMALHAPGLFGSCIAQSPAYWPAHGEIFHTRLLANAPLIEFILQTGTIGDAAELTRLMHRKLELLGAKCSYQEYAQGHTWGNWRCNLPYALEAWIGNQTGGSFTNLD